MERALRRRRLPQKLAVRSVTKIRTNMRRTRRNQERPRCNGLRSKAVRFRVRRAFGRNDGRNRNLPLHPNNATKLRPNALNKKRAEVVAAKFMWNLNRKARQSRHLDYPRIDLKAAPYGQNPRRTIDQQIQRLNSRMNN